MTRMEKMEVTDLLYRLQPGEGSLVCLGMFVQRTSVTFYTLNDVEGLRFYEVVRRVRG